MICCLIAGCNDFKQRNAFPLFMWTNCLQRLTYLGGGCVVAALHVISEGNINFASNEMTWKVSERFDNSLAKPCLRTLIGIQKRQQDCQSTALASGKFFGCKFLLPCKRKQEFESESAVGHCCAAARSCPMRAPAVQKRPSHNMPRSAAQQKSDFQVSK